MKSPIGPKDFCELDVSKRVDKAVKVLAALAELPDEHCAFHLLRHQTGRLNYWMRTTPSTTGSSQFARFDRALRAAYENITSTSLSDVQWKQAQLPVRLGGFGLTSSAEQADVAYYASRAATWDRCLALYADFGAATLDPIEAAVANINARLPSAGVACLPVEGAAPRQQAVAARLADATAAAMMASALPQDRARLQAYSAPMAGRWMAATPSKTLDKHLSSYELSTAAALQLGVDVSEGGGSCRLCGMVMDSKGLHPSSCMSGGRPHRST